jgi:threonine/homoserine/homoserine lactone efflux protein
MSLDLLLALIAFAFVTSITPGPNNMMLLASGVSFGLRRSLPHMLGISLGFGVMVLAVGFGLGELFQRLPVLYRVLRYLGALYLLFLAYRIARAGAPEGGGQALGKPFTFVQAAAFQWVNPKAWVMAISGLTTFTVPDRFGVSVLLVAGLFALVNYPCVGAWAAAGTLLRRYLTHPDLCRLFNLGMALLLVASLYPLLAELHGALR